MLPNLLKEYQDLVSKEQDVFFIFVENRNPKSNNFSNDSLFSYD